MGPDISFHANARLAREEAYWNDVYRSTGAEHHKYVWVKQVEGKSYVGECFYRLAGRLRQKRVLSLGGGVDILGVFLAKAGNEIVTVDISPVAAAATIDLAKQEGVADNVTSLVGSSEDVALERESFDVVISKRALHHMDLDRTVGRVRDLLVDGGVFLAEEPVCLSRALEWIHQKLPFHPTAPRTEDERELTEQDLSLIRRTFREVRVSYFDFLARESVAYLLVKLKMGWLLNPIGKLDYVLINQGLPILRRVATYAIVEATK